MEQLWYQKHRPRNLDEYVFTDEKLKERVKGWLDKGEFPNLLLSGNPGSGKSSLARMLIEQCGFLEVDVKITSASIYRKIDDFTDEIMGFVENQSFGPKGRVVLLDEADQLSKTYQDALRNLVAGDETHYRFILTCNYPHKLSAPLKSRFRHYTFDNLNREQFAMRLATIIMEENVTFDPEVLTEYVNKYYPDLRKAIEIVEDNSVNGVLETESTSNADDGPDWMKEAVVWMQDGEIRKAREHITKNISYDDFEDFYQLLYTNLHWFGGDDEDKKDAALLSIKDAYVEDTSVANREIVLSACLTKLNRIRNGKK